MASECGSGDVAIRRDFFTEGAVRHWSKLRGGNHGVAISEGI